MIKCIPCKTGAMQWRGAARAAFAARLGVSVPQNEISEWPPPDGSPGFGWSRRPIFPFDPAAAWALRRKVSESDRYVVFGPTHTVVFELRDDGLLGYMGVTVASSREKTRWTHSIVSALPLGSFGMPAESRRGQTRYRKKGAAVDFAPMEGGARIVRVDLPRQGAGRSVRGELVLSEPDSPPDSLVCRSPWRDDRRAFRLSRCSPWYTAEGVVQYGTTEIVFTRGNSWGVLDWTRGVRPRRDARRWATACGSVDGRLLGLCLGDGGEDQSAGSPNGFFVDGALHKLGRVTFGAADGSAPWRLADRDGRLEMTFSPAQERSDKGRVLLHSFSRRQFFGGFSGRVALDDGGEIRFSGLSGFAERSRARF